MVANVRPPLLALAEKTQWTRWSDLYRHDEQCERALRVSLRLDDDYNALGIPGPLRQQYLDASQPFARQHPFLAADPGGGMRTSNLVFEAYLHAWALRYGSDILRNSVRAKLRSPDRLVQPLLGYFILLAEAGSSKSISSEDLPFLYGSLRAASTSSSQVQLLVDADPSSIECAFTWPSGEDAIVQLDGQRLHLGNTMSDLVVIAPTSVCVIGSAEQSLVIGPDVRIECASLEVEAPTMRVLTGSFSSRTSSSISSTPRSRHSN